MKNYKIKKRLIKLMAYTYLCISRIFFWYTMEQNYYNAFPSILVREDDFDFDTAFSLILCRERFFQENSKRFKYAKKLIVTCRDTCKYFRRRFKFSRAEEWRKHEKIFYREKILLYRPIYIYIFTAIYLILLHFLFLFWYFFFYRNL